MKQNEGIQMIRALSEAPGAPGFEDAVVNILKPYAEPYGAVTEDTRRNLYVQRSGGAAGLPVVQLDAHTDEVAFMVQAIRPNGTLRVLPLGRWVESGIQAHRVRVRNTAGQYVPGIIASVPPHLASPTGQTSAAANDTVTVDIGAVSSTEAVNDFGIRIGEPVVADVPFIYDANHDLMMGKAFDCRLGCAAILGVLETLGDKRLGVNLTGAWAVQEEVGLRGAMVTANYVKPDIAIVFEGCPADDTVAEPYMIQTALKKGPMLRFIDQKMITHPRFQRYALDLSERLDIPVQASVRSGGSTNGASIHVSHMGVPCIVIGIPTRYIHTHYGIASYADYKHSVRLAAAVIESLNTAVISGF